MARTVSLKNGLFTFAVTKDLRGTAPKIITGKGFVETPDDNSDITPGTEWVLISQGPMEKWGTDIRIGGDSEDWGYGNWGTARIVRLDGKTYIAWHYHLPKDPIVFDKDMGGGEFALTMEHFQKLLNQYPYKP